MNSEFGMSSQELSANLQISQRQTLRKQNRIFCWYLNLSQMMFVMFWFLSTRIWICSSEKHGYFIRDSNNLSDYVFSLALFRISRGNGKKPRWNSIVFVVRIEVGGIYSKIFNIRFRRAHENEIENIRLILLTPSIYQQLLACVKLTLLN